MAISNISVSVQPYLLPDIGLDPSRVCIIVPSADTPVAAFSINRNSYSEQINLAITKDADRTTAISAAQDFFSESSGKSYAVMVVVTPDDLTNLDIADEAMQYGFAVLPGMRADFSEFSALLTKVAANNAFLCVNDASSPVPTDSGQARLIQFVHETPMALRAISFLAQQLSVDPGFNCATNITNSTLSGDKYSEGLQQQLLSAGCNIYCNVDGLLQIQNGMTNDKTKIEAKYFSQNYLGYYIRTETAKWKANRNVKQGDIIVIRDFVESLFNELLGRNLLKNTEELGGSAYVIRNISFATVDGRIGANIYVDYSFNGNVDTFSFFIQEVA
ncbi:MAG: hypothetical protein NC548_32310 [Lachnospiraceae bacterium]|nr:hypothetical protein [Lachnospiraceae bacterium]